MSGEINNENLRTKQFTSRQNEVKTDNNGTKTETTYQNTIFSFNDDDGIIQKEDLNLSVESDAMDNKSKTLYGRIEKFFEKNTGKKWNVLNKTYLFSLINRFNRKASFKSEEIVTDGNGTEVKRDTEERSNGGTKVSKTKVRTGWLFGRKNVSTTVVDKENNTVTKIKNKYDSYGVLRKTMEKIKDLAQNITTKTTDIYRKDGSLRDKTTVQDDKLNHKMTVSNEHYDEYGNKIRETNFDTTEYS